MTTEKNTSPVREPYDAMGPVDAPTPPAARATLADVQPGGRVRLGDEALAQGCDELRMRTDGERAAYLEGVSEGRRAALSAQPSPGGQGDELDLDRVLSLADVHAEESREDGVRLLDRGGLLAFARDVASALAARQPVYEGHTWVSDYVLAGLRERAALPLQLRNGEVWHWQGDGHDFPESLACPVIMSAETLRALLAARQPVGEPVAWLVHWSDMPLESPEVTRSASRISEVSALTNSPRIVPLYAVPPAQAVDLGAVREALQAAEGLATVCASVDGYSREEVAASGRAMRQQFADALAKVDSQAVGNG